MKRNLDQLKPGQWGYVTALEGRGKIRYRLAELGITPGVRILVRKSAPFGDPIQIALRGFALSLRKKEAQMILVDGEYRP